MTSQRWQNKNKKTLAKKFSAIFYFDEIEGVINCFDV